MSKPKSIVSLEAIKEVISDLEDDNGDSDLGVRDWQRTEMNELAARARQEVAEIELLVTTVNLML
jgi:hypothetical protein